MGSFLLIMLYLSIGFGFLYAMDKSKHEATGAASFICVTLWPILVIIGLTAGVLNMFDKEDDDVRDDG